MLTEDEEEDSVVCEEMDSLEETDSDEETDSEEYSPMLEGASEDGSELSWLEEGSSLEEDWGGIVVLDELDEGIEQDASDKSAKTKAMRGFIPQHSLTIVFVDKRPPPAKDMRLDSKRYQYKTRIYPTIWRSREIRTRERLKNVKR